MVYLLSALLELAIIIIITLILLSLHKKSEKNFFSLFSVLWLIYGLTFILHLFWFSRLEQAGIDYFIIHSVFLVGKTTIFVIIFSYLLNKKSFLFSLFLYILAALAIQFSFQGFYFVTGFISYTLLLLVFIYAVGSNQIQLKSAALFGGLYSFISAFLLVLMFLEKVHTSDIFVLAEILLVISFWYLHRYFSSSGFFSSDNGFKEHRTPVLSYFKIILVTLIILILTLITTISVHELGHALTGEYYNCESTKAIIYLKGALPHTELKCDDGANIIIILLAGVAAPLAIGIFLLLNGKGYILGVGNLMIGFSFFLSKQDFEVMKLPGSLSLLVLLISFLFLFLGIRETIYYLYREELLK